jgi:hypothetical protein
MEGKKHFAVEFVFVQMSERKGEEKGKRGPFSLEHECSGTFSAPQF